MANEHEARGGGLVNIAPLIFLGTFFALATSWLGFVLGPQLQLGNTQQQEVIASGQMYPVIRSGLARQGEQVYRENGCFYCHSQQVRPKGFGSDVERQWGARDGIVQSVNQDYLYDNPVMLGSQRVGPDLANVGLRQGTDTNGIALLKRLYDPHLIMPNSVMPPYRFLFTKRKLGATEKPSDEALKLDSADLKGYEVIPTDKAYALVAYLQSLRSDGVLYETPPFKKATNAVPAAAAPAASTNAPAK